MSVIARALENNLAFSLLEIYTHAYNYPIKTEISTTACFIKAYKSKLLNKGMSELH